MKPPYQDGETAWRQYMQDILDHGESVAPRGQPTREVLAGLSVTCDLARPLITSPARKLNYRFACAEALWVVSGDNRVEPLARHVARMREFSDDGVTLSGAYGPPVVDQLPWVVRQLIADRDTRQATLTTWRPRPGPSKDVPCTVAMTFSIRRDKLYQHVYMRSSDGWLGLPYDLFTFAMIGTKVACLYNDSRQPSPPVELGALTVTPTSAHLYERDLGVVDGVLGSDAGPPAPVTPLHHVIAGRFDELALTLAAHAAMRGPPDVHVVDLWGGL